VPPTPDDIATRDADFAAQADARDAAAHGMRWVPGGSFFMGSDYHYPEEAPAHRVRVAGFWMDRAPVTNARFARFVQATGYVTRAEIQPRTDAVHARYAGSWVFVPTPGPPRRRRPQSWWHYKADACWRRPLGAGSSIEGLEQHPVVHVAFGDAEAFAAWEGKALPSEAEWEFAARGGLDGADFAWGDEFAPGGRHLANTWQGEFPWENRLEDGYARTSPIGTYPANGYGLFDMIGNVWEWTTDVYRPCHPGDPHEVQFAACHRRDARARPTADTRSARGSTRCRVLKGGSHLCAPNHCPRFRPAARLPERIDSTSSHVGFRCIVRTTGVDAGAARQERAHGAGIDDVE
jgi:formylglycine-generating enzyme required for sulfatase activity